MARTEPPASTVTASVASGAVFDDTGQYRYRLWRRWADGPDACFVMLNPSTADATRDDATIRRCTWFARESGWGGLVVVNLFAYCATHPRLLRAVADAAGPGNARHIEEAVADAGIVVAAWGNLPRGIVAPTIPATLHCLGTNRNGSPRHPLYVRGDTPLVPYPA